MTHEVNLLMLNDYCLENILAYLDIKSQINFAHTCRYFRNIFDYWAKRQHKIISKKVLQLPHDEQEQYFELVGEHIVECAAKLPLNESLDLIQKYCTHIEHICYCSYEPNRNIVPSLTSLRSVHIYGRSGTAEEMEESVLALKDLPNLKRVTVEAILYNGNYLCELKQLEELAINQSRITTDNLIACFRSMQNLRKLSINFIVKGNEDITSIEVFNALVQHCINLEELSFWDCNVAYEIIAKLPKLKRLEIQGVSSGRQSHLLCALAEKSILHLEDLIIPDYVLTYADAKHLKQLKSLKTLQCWVGDKRCYKHFTTLVNLERFEARFKGTGFYQSELLPLLKSCRNLHCIRVAIKNEHAKQFVFEVIEVLRQIRNPSEQRPLELWAGKYPNAFGKEILQSPEYLSAKDFLIMKWK